MNPHDIYHGSNGQATMALYAKLETLGPVGIIALNLFRAQKASARAKVYSRRYKADTYDKKNWSMGNLCDQLEKHATALNIRYGWRIDPKQDFHNWVLYVEIPGHGQVSFHAAARGKGPDYQLAWDGSGQSAQRIIAWTTELLLGSGRAYENPERCSDHSRGSGVGQDPQSIGPATPPPRADHSTDRTIDGAGHRPGQGDMHKVSVGPPPTSAQQQDLV